MKALISLSGGLDSATLLGQLVKEQGNKNVIGVSFNYGSKHNAYELHAVSLLALHYNIEIINIEMTNITKHFESNLLKTGGEIPEGHYEEESMKTTVVPARNMIFASILTGLAISKKANTVYLGIHAGDHAIYPDCRPEFYWKMKDAIYAASAGEVFLQAPFLMLNKKQIVTFGDIAEVPFHLTRTCYKDQPIACGKCGSCVERLEAFKLNELKDPVSYE